jgi:hypothetical protein
VLRYREELELSEIADTLQTPLNTSRATFAGRSRYCARAC